MSRSKRDPEMDAVLVEQALAAATRPSRAPFRDRNHEIARLRESRRDFGAALRLARRSSGRRLSSDQIVKTLIDSGEIAEARERLRRTPSPENFALHQEARIAIASGDFEAGRRLTTALLDGDAIAFGVTRFALLQMRANAFFELGHFKPAARDLRAAAELEALFPNSPVNLYCEVLRARIDARQGRAEEARRREIRLWAGMSSDPETANADRVLTLLRLRIDLDRLAGLPTVNAAIASHAAAVACGDGLYRDLALVDLHLALDAGSRRRFADSLAPVVAKHARAARFLAEVETLESGSESSASACESARAAFRARKGAVSTVFGPADLSPAMIVFLEAGIRVDCAEWRAIPFVLQGAPLALARALAAGPIEKDVAFGAAWGLPKQTAHRYDALIRKTLARLRKQTGAEVRSKGGVLFGDRTLFV